MLYGLHRSQNGTVLRYIPGYNSEDCAYNHCDLHLVEVFLRDEHGNLRCRYRLFTEKPHSIEMALAYDVKCPKCGESMKQIDRTLSTHVLGLYACPACDMGRT